MKISEEKIKKGFNTITEITNSDSALKISIINKAHSGYEYFPVKFVKQLIIQFLIIMLASLFISVLVSNLRVKLPQQLTDESSLSLSFQEKLIIANQFDLNSIGVIILKGIMMTLLKITPILFLLILITLPNLKSFPNSEVFNEKAY